MFDERNDGWGRALYADTKVYDLYLMEGAHRWAGAFHKLETFRSTFSSQIGTASSDFVSTSCYNS